MTKFRLKKAIIGSDPGTVFDYHGDDCKHYGEGVELVSGESLGQILDLIKAVGIRNTDYFEEIKDTPIPSFKVGDYAVVIEIPNPMGESRYIKIIDIYLYDGAYRYNYDGDNWYSERNLRKPTKQELDLYFR